MTRVGAAAAGCPLLSLRLAAQPPRTSTPIGQERAVPRHLKDSFDFVTFDRRETERKPGRAPKQPDSL